MIKFQVIVVFLVIALSQCFVDKALYDEIKSKATFEVLDYEVVK
jgi:hypothetical protein